MIGVLGEDIQEVEGARVVPEGRLEYLVGEFSTVMIGNMAHERGVMRQSQPAHFAFRAIARKAKVFLVLIAELLF